MSFLQVFWDFLREIRAELSRNVALFQIHFFTILTILNSYFHKFFKASASKILTQNPDGFFRTPQSIFCYALINAEI